MAYSVRAGSPNRPHKSGNPELLNLSRDLRNFLWITSQILKGVAKTTRCGAIKCSRRRSFNIVYVLKTIQSWTHVQLVFIFSWNLIFLDTRLYIFPLDAHIQNLAAIYFLSCTLVQVWCTFLKTELSVFDSTKTPISGRQALPVKISSRCFLSCTFLYKKKHRP